MFIILCLSTKKAYSTRFIKNKKANQRLVKVMPLIEISGYGFTTEQKRSIAQEVVEVISKISGKDKKLFVVVFRDINSEDWSMAG
jgi:4-oxalocrotonate tautomerase family enzyme